MKKSNKSVLFICADQWRWDCFGFMKHKNAVTPNLDKLAKKSTVFKSHFTGIVPCGPSRATMLTGLYPFIHRSVRNGAPLDKRFTNIAKEVKKIGHAPKLFGYTDTTWDPRFLKDNDKIMVMLKTLDVLAYKNPSINGKMLVYLDDGKVISVSKPSYRDYVDEFCISILSKKKSF